MCYTEVAQPWKWSTTSVQTVLMHSTGGRSPPPHCTRHTCDVALEASALQPCCTMPHLSDVALEVAIWPPLLLARHREQLARLGVGARQAVM